MPKLPFMMFFPSDWFNDTMVLSAEARGSWINLICLMWNAKERGVWSGTYEEFARVTGTPWESAPRLIEELRKVATVTLRDKNVTLECRRIKKDDLHYKNHSIRQKRYREKHVSDALVTHKTLDVRRQTLDVKTLTSTKRVFVKPSAEDVNTYGASIGYQIDGYAFCDFYESKGWKVGNTPMRSWQAAVRTWKRKDNAERAVVVALKSHSLPPPPVYKDIPESERMNAEEMKQIRDKAMGGLNVRANVIR